MGSGGGTVEGARATPPIIRIRGLTKRYGDREALADLDLDVDRGACLGIFGHNGSGKTTLLKVLSTLIQPTAGEVVVDGHHLPSDAAGVRRRIGVLLDAPFLPLDFTLSEGLSYSADLYGVPLTAERIEAVADRVGLLWRLRDPLRTFSRGMAQRASLACLLLAEPDILILDEPFTGLDQRGCALVESAVREHTSAGGTVLLVTHELERGCRVCQDALVLRQGRSVFLRRAGEWSFDELVEALR